MRNSQQLGFTIIELLVSIAIFLVLAGILLANFHQGDYANELKLSADLVAVNIREAQNKSISGISAVTVAGYGIYFDNADTSFINYQDQGTSARQYDADEEINTVSLKKNVSFVSAGAVDLFFEVPGGAVYLNGLAQSGTVTITLQHSVTNKSIDVTVLPFSGQVSVSNIY